jgi:hypothetical protein
MFSQDEVKAMHVYLLLDRTGSMRSMWDEALGAVNGYVEEFAKGSGPNDAVTLAVFDALDGLQFDLLRRSTHPLNWKKVSDDEASPRGQTPLYDAIARIVALAEKDAPDKAVIAIMTDGQENASREVTRENAKAALDAAQKKDWQVIFLGADFGRFDDAVGVGVRGSKSMAMARGNYAGSMKGLAQKSRAYALHGGDIEFDAKDRADAGEAAVKKRDGG